MKKLKFIFSIAITAAFLVSCNSEPKSESKEMSAEDKLDSLNAEAEGTYRVQPENSTVTWTGNMTKVGGTSLYNHTGNLKVTEGSLTIKEGEISDGNFVVDMSSMVTTDENYDEKDRSRENLIGHLSSPDFFAIDSFPQAMFTVKKVEGDKVHGDLTVRGITKEEVIEGVSTEMSNGVLKASGKLVFDRQDYDINFSMEEAQGVKDKFIDDDIEVMVNFTAVK